ncbi:STAS domain-containing protein [Streptomyces sp. NPDC047017]|uniref:STAS domain-containing protein n=1 Tax=Streptomyces sp. NPDC047017 TaxID=3155024 RepID=UPI0033D75E5F
MSPLNITHDRTATTYVLHLAGELDHTHATTLRRQVEQLALRPGQRLVLDLARLEFCDSTGITALLAARQHAQAADADITLASVPAHTLRVFRIIGLDQVFHLQADANAP